MSQRKFPQPIQAPAIELVHPDRIDERATLFPEGVWQHTDVQLTNDQMIALNGTSITLVAAPGASRIVLVHRVFYVSDSAGAAWSESADNMVVEYGGGTDILTIETTGLITTGTVQFRSMMAPEAVLTPEANVVIQLTNPDDAYGAGDAANNFSIRTWYSVVDAVAFS